MKELTRAGSSPAVVPGIASPDSKTARADPPHHSAPAFLWSWKLLTVANIDVYVHGTFVLLIAFVGFNDLIAGRGLPAMVRDVVLLLAVFAAVVLHEFGHALTARRFGIRTLDITLLPVGGVARLEKLPDTPRQQLLVALAGPAVSLAIAGVLAGVVTAIEGTVGFASLGGANGTFLTQLMWINVALAAFNLLPGYPMDGGRVLRALLAMRMEPELATQLAARVGQGVAVIFGLVGLLVNPLLVVVAVVVWLGAKAEHSLSTVKVALAGLSVRQGMITDFRTLSPKDPLSRAVELTLAGFQQDFPVMDGTQLGGVLTHGDLLRGLSGHGANLAVEHAMRSEFETASPAESLDGALTRMHQGKCPVLVVVERRDVVGVLTVGNIGELLAMAAAGRRSSAVPGRAGNGKRLANA
ncbi:MAG: site-2 protease family protein [Polyangiaceae bacterium]|nr:site-2 protease family protein [Polyangiaceae bacterium]